MNVGGSEHDSVGDGVQVSVGNGVWDSVAFGVADAIGVAVAMAVKVYVGVTRTASIPVAYLFLYISRKSLIGLICHIPAPSNSPAVMFSGRGFENLQKSSFTIGCLGLLMFIDA